MPAEELKLEREPALEERPDETLDPVDWEALRDLGHRIVDDVVRYHAEVRERPAWQPVPEEVRAALATEFPHEPRGAEDAYAAFRELVGPYPYGNIHPRAWGWVNGTGTTLGALAELLAASMNPNAWGAQQASTYVELQVLAWLKRALGFPAGASGLLVSGASVANLVGLAAAREAASRGEASRRGLVASGEQMVVYASEEVHNSVDKAVGLLGIGWDGLRKIPADAAFGVRLDLLGEAIRADRAAGKRPIGVVGTAGTVNTGAIDDLDGLADLAAREGLWLHVDGAFGGLAALSPALRPRLAGIERADSIAVDLHKWLFVPIEAGCALVRDARWQRGAFSAPAPYLEAFDRGVTSGPEVFSSLGPQLTRSFRALKVWLSLQTHGTAKYGRLVEQNVRQARLLARRVRSHARLELLAPVPLNVVCFRYRPEATSTGEQLDALNRELLVRLQLSGRAVVSSTRLRGAFALRAAITNHRSRSEDFETLVAEVARIGDELAAAGAGGPALTPSARSRARGASCAASRSCAAPRPGPSRR